MPEAGKYLGSSVVWTEILLARAKVVIGSPEEEHQRG